MSTMKRDPRDTGTNTVSLVSAASAETKLTREHGVLLFSILTRVMDAAFQVGYHSFKANAAYVIKTIQERFGEAAADLLTIDYLQGAYIAMAGEFGDRATPKRDVIKVTDKAELTEQDEQVEEAIGGLASLFTDTKIATYDNDLSVDAFLGDDKDTGRTQAGVVQEPGQVPEGNPDQDRSIGDAEKGSLETAGEAEPGAAPDAGGYSQESEALAPSRSDLDSALVDPEPEQRPSRGFLNRHVLKPETIEQIEAMGEVASQVADRWAGGWPKKTRKLEAEGRLIEAVRYQAEQEQAAVEYERANRWVGGIESRQLFGIDLSAPPPI